jgi:hypothetical protein
MQDLSEMARNGPWVTSQAAGNMTSSNDEAMTAPGSQPVDPLPDRADQGDPKVTSSDDVPVGTPAARVTAGYNPAAIIWKPIG